MGGGKEEAPEKQRGRRNTECLREKKRKRKERKTKFQAPVKRKKK